METLDHLSLALDEGYLDRHRYGVLRGKLEETWKLLNGYIAYLARCARDGVPQATPSQRWEPFAAQKPTTNNPQPAT